MDIMELGAIGELVGGIGSAVGGVAVALTLIYLAVQVGGSKKALKTQTHHNLLSIAQRPYELMVGDEELAGVVDRGNEEPETLSREEWVRYCAYTLMVINAWEYGYYLDRDGATPHELWVGANAHFADQAARFAGWERYWAENSDSFAEPFRSYAASHFPKAGA